MAINVMKNSKMINEFHNNGIELTKEFIRSLRPLINDILLNGLNILRLLKNDILVKLVKNIDKYPVTIIRKSKIFQKFRKYELY